ALPLDLLLRALSSHVGTVPNIVTPFVPNLVRLLGESDDTSVRNSIRSLLGNYASSSPERAKEIESSLRGAPLLRKPNLQIIIGKKNSIINPQKLINYKSPP